MVGVPPVGSAGCASAASGYWSGRLGSMRRVRAPNVESNGNPDQEETVERPVLDLVAQYRAIKDDVLPALQAVIESQQFVMGPLCRSSRPPWPGSPTRNTASHARAGRTTLLLPLKALGLNTGDEVITTPFTFFATAGAIHNAGGTPVFVDIEPGTFNIDPAAVEAAITPRTRAIVPVHLYGQMGRDGASAGDSRELAVSNLSRTQPRRSARAARSTGNGAWRASSVGHRLLSFSEQEPGRVG